MNIQSYAVSGIDHLFVIVFALGFPLLGFFSYRKIAPKLLSGALSRRREYLRTILIQWALLLLGVALWHMQQRSWADLGFSLTFNGRFALAGAGVVLVIVYMVMQLLAVRRADENTIASLADEIESVKPLLPQSSAELHAFYGLSLTAGIVEEVLWRGFLIAYLANFMPIWAAAILSACAFGIGHAYQGIANTPKIVAVGLALSGLYLLAGSLWLPIVLHAIVDMLQGRTVFDLLQAQGQTGEHPQTA